MMEQSQLFIAPGHDQEQLKKSKVPLQTDSNGRTRSIAERPYAPEFLDEIFPGDVLMHCVGHMTTALMERGDKTTGLLDGVPDPFSLEGINELYFFALGRLAQIDEEAAHRLHNIAGLATMELSKACRAAPELFKPIARKEFYWPSFIGEPADIQRSNKHEIEHIELGAECGLNTHGKWTTQTTETDIALKLWQHIELARRGQRSWFPVTNEDELIARTRSLQPLSRDNYKQWWRIAERIFVEKRKDFENLECFTAYWPPRGAKSMAYKDAKNPRPLIRRDIKAKIKQAFRSIAPRLAEEAL